MVTAERGTKQEVQNESEPAIEGGIPAAPTRTLTRSTGCWHLLGLVRSEGALCLPWDTCVQWWNIYYMGTYMHQTRYTDANNFVHQGGFGGVFFGA